MGNIYSSGNKYKDRAEAALEKAKAIEDAQGKVEFGRNLLANIRQERIARAQLELGNTSADYSSSSAAGAVATIDSSLASEMRFSYESSHRAQKITDLQDEAQKNFKKYAKQQKTRATAFAVTGVVAGAALGAVAGGLAGVSAAGMKTAITAGAQLGQGAMQLASNTGQEQAGINNVLGGFGTLLDGALGDEGPKIEDKLKLTSRTSSGTIYQTTSIDPTTNQEIANSKRYYTYSPIAGKAVPLIGGIFS